MNTPDLFDYRPRAHAHKGGPATAAQAARAAAPLARGQAARVLIRLRKLGEATATELAHAMELDLYAVRRRLTDLKQAGHILPTGATGVTTAGRRELVYRPAKP